MINKAEQSFLYTHPCCGAIGCKVRMETVCIFFFLLKRFWTTMRLEIYWTISYDEPDEYPKNIPVWSGSRSCFCWGPRWSSPLSRRGNLLKWPLVAWRRYCSVVKIHMYIRYWSLKTVDSPYVFKDNEPVTSQIKQMYLELVLCIGLAGSLGGALAF